MYDAGLIMLPARLQTQHNTLSPELCISEYLLPALKLGGGIKCQYRYAEPAVTDPTTPH